MITTAERCEILSGNSPFNRQYFPHQNLVLHNFDLACFLQFLQVINFKEFKVFYKLFFDHWSIISAIYVQVKNIFLNLILLYKKVLIVWFIFLLNQVYLNLYSLSNKHIRVKSTYFIDHLNLRFICYFYVL